MFCDILNNDQSRGSILDLLRNIKYHAQNNLMAVGIKGVTTIEEIPTVPTTIDITISETLTTSLPSEVTQGPTVQPESLDMLLTMAPLVPGLTKPHSWVDLLIHFWSWDDKDISLHAAQLPIVRTCVRFVNVSQFDVMVSYLLCNLHVYQNIIVLREVAECMLHKNMSRSNIKELIPVDFTFSEQCKDTVVDLSDDPFHVCVFSIGGLLVYPYAVLCTIHNFENMYEEMGLCDVSVNPYQDGVIVMDVPRDMNGSCKHYHLAPDIRVFEFAWCARKVQYVCIVMSLIIYTVSMVAIVRAKVGKNVRRYALLFPPFSMLWLVWKSQQLLFIEVHSLQHLAAKKGFQLLSKIVEVFPVTINAYLMTGITLEKFLAGTFPLWFKTKVNIIVKVFPVTVLVAVVLSLLDIIQNIYFSTKTPDSFIGVVIANEGENPFQAKVRSSIFSIVFISLRGVVSAIVCSVVNVVNTVNLCKRFYAPSSLPVVKTGRLKQNLICSLVASILLIGCIVDPIRELYTDMVREGMISEMLSSSVSNLAIISAISEVLITLSIGANVVYLCLLCPGIWQYFIRKLPCSCHNRTNKERLVKKRCHLNSSISQTSHNQVSSNASSDGPGFHMQIVTDPACVTDNDLGDPEGPYVF